MMHACGIQLTVSIPVSNQKKTDKKFESCDIPLACTRIRLAGEKLRLPFTIPLQSRVQLAIYHSFTKSRAT